MASGTRGSTRKEGGQLLLLPLASRETTTK